jgi:hypothetical protein
VSKAPAKRAAATTEKPQTHAGETCAFMVRGGFVLTLGKKAYRAGEIVDLTEAQAVARKHMIELAPEQGEA